MVRRGHEFTYAYMDDLVEGDLGPLASRSRPPLHLHHLESKPLKMADDLDFDSGDAGAQLPSQSSAQY